MLTEELDVHIMLDCELAGHPKLHNPVITQIGAVHFDIDTGEELSRFNKFPCLQSCLDCGLVQDECTTKPTKLELTQNNTNETHLPLFYQLLLF